MADKITLESNDAELRKLANNYAECYQHIVKVIISTIDEQVQKLSLQGEAKAKFVMRGIELCNDTALKMAVGVEANRDNLLVKALDSNSQMIGMMAQGGLVVDELNFKIYYQALKQVMKKGGVEVDSYAPAGKQNAPRQ